MSKPTQLTLEMFCFGATVTLGIAGCFAFWDHLAAQRQIKALIDEENKALLQKGLRWYLPKGSETIELLTDYKFLFNQPAFSNEEIAYESYKLNQKFRNPPARNDQDSW